MIKMEMDIKRFDSSAKRPIARQYIFYTIDSRAVINVLCTKHVIIEWDNDIDSGRKAISRKVAAKMLLDLRNECRDECSMCCKMKTPAPGITGKLPAQRIRAPKVMRGAF